jgi:LCP family protein required for cell wall assembly
MSRYDDNDDTGGRGSRKRRAKGPKSRDRRSGRRRIAGWIAVMTTILVSGTSLVAYAAYLGTLHSIATFDPAATLGSHRPPSYNASLNLLVVGSDSRAGTGRRFGSNIQGQRSDTMMIVHIRPQHRGVVVISLPRDTMVPVLGCKPDGLGDPGQPSQPGNNELLNATFAYGGPPCLWRTVEQQTGIHIDHYLGLTFTGFMHVINDIGGVSVCLPRAIKDPKSGLNLSAGKHHVFGPQALAFWRERYVGLGSDLQRIQRQQYLMAGLMQEVKSGTLLNNYGRMYSVLRDAAKALTTDRGLSLTDMISLALDLKGLANRSVQFLTAPNVPDPSDVNRVLWEQPQASELFHAIAHDTTLPRMKKGPARPRPPATTSPSLVKVEVLNGNGLPGAAGQAAGELASRGFAVTGASNAASTSYSASVIQYTSAAEMPAVNTLKAVLGSVQVQQVTGLTPGVITLIIGSSFQGLTSPASSGSSHSPRSPGQGQNLGASFGGINASTNICSDRSAFAGPDNPNPGT